MLLAMEKFAPSHVGKGGFARAMRLGGFIGLCGGFIYFYQRSIRTLSRSRPLQNLPQHVDKWVYPSGPSFLALQFRRCGWCDFGNP